MERTEKLKEMLKSSPEDSFLKHALALELVKKGEDAYARNLFESILENEPGYVGSYYHLARLLERMDEIKSAIEVYEKGMTECRKINDRHALSELQMAYDDLTN